MQAILGVIFHFIGGFTSFSFFVRSKKNSEPGMGKLSWNPVQVREN